MFLVWIHQLVHFKCNNETNVYKSGNLIYSNVNRINKNNSRNNSRNNRHNNIDNTKVPSSSSDPQYQ